MDPRIWKRNSEQIGIKGEVRSGTTNFLMQICQDCSTYTQFYQTFQEVTSMLLELFKKTEEKGTLSYSFYEASMILVPTSDHGATKKENYRPISLGT